MVADVLSRREQSRSQEFPVTEACAASVATRLEANTVIRCLPNGSSLFIGPVHVYVRRDRDSDRAIRMHRYASLNNAHTTHLQ